jgi:hypothetical protein
LNFLQLFALQTTDCGPCKFTLQVQCLEKDICVETVVCR